MVLRHSGDGCACLTLPGEATSPLAKLRAIESGLRAPQKRGGRLGVPAESKPTTVSFGPEVRSTIYRLPDMFKKRRYSLKDVFVEHRIREVNYRDPELSLLLISGRKRGLCFRMGEAGN